MAGSTRAVSSHKVRGEYLYEPDLTLFAPALRQQADAVKEFNLDGYTLVHGYPKTGTNWMQEISWLVLNDGDTEQAKQSPVFARVPILEFTAMGEDKSGMELAQKAAGPKVVKSHLPLRFFSKQMAEGKDFRMIVPIRNPKDTLTSYYHFYKIIPDGNLYTGDWEDFFTLIEAKRLVFGDYFDWYSEWIPQLDKSNVLLVKYEDSKKDLAQTVRRVAKFLNKELSEEVIQKIADHCSFENMSKNPMTNFQNLPHVVRSDIGAFMRKGVVGDWKNLFSKDQSTWVDERYQQLFQGSGVQLEFE